MPDHRLLVMHPCFQKVALNIILRVNAAPPASEMESVIVALDEATCPDHVCESIRQ